MKKITLVSSSLLLILWCCNISLKVDVPQDAVIIPTDGEVPERTGIDQGWTDEMGEKFWFTSQGAHIMPYLWFTWLEQADSDELFRNTSHMEALGYLPVKASKLNPSGLPIGFTTSRASTIKDSWMGFNCAACHTNQLDYQGVKYIIDGAPTLANFVQFFDETVAALNATYEDEAKFMRFAKRVLGGDYSTSTVAKLKQQLYDVALASSNRQMVNALPADYPKDFTSFGRLDAFGNIENAGSAFALGDLSNRNTPTAPVSYPFLWGTHQSDVVQWNGSAPNTPVVGPLVRNVGQVIGVFGGLKITKANFWQRLRGKKHHYTSTIDFHGLGALEGYVKILEAPEWTEMKNFPDLDMAKVERGAILYADHCASCHQVIKKEDQFRKYKAEMTPVADLGTDLMTAWSAEHHLAKSEILEGSLIKPGKPRMGDTTISINIAVNGAINLILKNPVATIEAAIETGEVKSNKKWSHHVLANAAARDSIADERADAHDFAPFKEEAHNLDGLHYKGRPLNGIWATAPYLHNGSVPDLWSLLLPEDERPKTFWVGNREFDPVNVGYRSDVGKNEFHVLGKDGKIMKGNSNLGHRYGTELNAADRWALVEYMKTL
ncbi:MAG: di-heme-cytochrome C peroxidase [Bacteroidota bacterium]